MGNPVAPGNAGLGGLAPGQGNTGGQPANVVTPPPPSGVQGSGGNNPGDAAITAGIQAAQKATNTVEKPPPAAAIPNPNSATLGVGGVNLSQLDPALQKYLATLQQMSTKSAGASGMTPALQAEVRQNAVKANVAIANMQKRQAQLKAFSLLATKGPQAVKVMQTVLNRNGADIPITGQVDPSTERAFQVYYQQEMTKASGDVHAALVASNPATLRAQQNAAMDKSGQGPRERAFLIQQEQQQLSAAMSSPSAQSPANQQQIQQLQAHIKLLRDGATQTNSLYDNVGVSQLFSTWKDGFVAEQKPPPKQIPEWSFENIKNVIAGAVGSEIAPETALMKAAFNSFSNAFGAQFDAAEMAARNSRLAGDNSFTTILNEVKAFGAADTAHLGMKSLTDRLVSGDRPVLNAVDETMTVSERNAAAKVGLIESPGKIIIGSETPQFAAINGPAPQLNIPGTSGGGFAGGQLWPIRDPAIANHYLVSGSIDLALGSIKDPTQLVTGPLSEVANVFGVGAETLIKQAEQSGTIQNLVHEMMLHTPDLTESAAKTAATQYVGATARRSLYENTVLGRTVDTVTRAALRRGAWRNVETLRSAVRGLDEKTAQDAIRAFVDAGPKGLEAQIDAGAGVIKASVIEGKFHPDMGYVRQFTTFATDKLGLANLSGKEGIFRFVKTPNLGHGFTGIEDRLTNVVQYFRQLAVAKGVVNTVYANSAMDVLDNGLESAVRAGKMTVDGYYHDIIDPVVASSDLPDRLLNVVDAIHAIDNPALTAAMEQMLRLVTPAADLLTEMPTSSFLEMVAQDEATPALVQRLEVAASIASGELGTAPMDLFYANLASWEPLVASDSRLVTDAAGNLGFKLPSVAGLETPKYNTVENEILHLGLPADAHIALQGRLLLAKGDSMAMKILYRDVLAMRDNPRLLDEFLRLIQENHARWSQFAISQEERVLRNTPKQLLGKFLSSLVTVVPPRELQFQRTLNDVLDGQLRRQAAGRYMDAFHISLPAQEQILREFQDAKTEEDFLGAVMHMERAALTAYGVKGKDANTILEMLTNRGDFQIRTPKDIIRAVDENGQPVSDLQALSQRIEHIKVPQPEEVAYNVRKAMIDGSIDSNAAQRLSARLEVLPHGAGQISLIFHHADGSLIRVTNAVSYIHNLWKFLVVSNAAMPLVGAAGGFLGTKGSLSKRLENAGIGFGLGSIGMSRFIFRVAGIDDRIRMGMQDGFTPSNMIPGVGAQRVKRYANVVGQDPFRRTMSDNIARVGNYGVSVYENDLLAHVDKDWVVLDNTDAHAALAWSRIVNHQIHPESDPVMAILLREQAGQFPANVLETVTPAIEGGLVRKELAKEVAAAPEVHAANAELRQAIQDAVDAVDRGDTNLHFTPNNGELLDSYPDRNVKFFYRGEPADFQNSARGSFWSGDQVYAEHFAGTDGFVYRVSLPVDLHGNPLVGEAATVDGNVGWMLTGPDHIWADAATPQYRMTWAEPKAEVTRVLTQRDHADKAIAEFLKTEEGKLWVERWKAARYGAKTPKQMIARMRNFLQMYSDKDIAALRVSGGLEGKTSTINVETLQRKLDSGLGPTHIHAQQTWKMPRHIGEVFRTGKDIIGKGVLTGPTNYNRLGFTTRAFNNEYDRLVMNGVDRAEAQKMADAFATETANRFFHRFDEPTRFAAKIDMFAPFQHAKEDLVRVYGMLAIENPMRTFRVVEAVARVFNNEKNNGMFTKDPVTGEWVLTIPGGGRLAHDLFGIQGEQLFQLPVENLLLAGASGYGGDFTGSAARALIPAAGGPFWTVFSNILAEHDPSLFQGDTALQKFLWPYGPGGDILSTNTSRLWMAMTGSAPPWEMDRGYWQNQINHYQREIGQELIYQHILANPKDIYWTPSSQMVDEATMKFFRAWSVFSSVVPTSTRSFLPNEAAYQQAVDAFTQGGLFPLDYNAFIKQFPQFAPYLYGGSATNYVGPEDLASLKKFGIGQPYPLQQYDPNTGMWTDNLPAGDYQAARDAGYITNESYAQFTEHFRQAQRENEYYTAYASAKLNPDIAEREREISALNHKYSDVVATVTAKADIKNELNTVMQYYPKGMRANALKRIQAQFGLSGQDMQKYLRNVSAGGYIDPTYTANAWANTRRGADVFAAVAAKFGPESYTSPQALQYIGTLMPTEQYRFWQYVQDSTGYSPNIENPADVMNQYYYADAMKHAVENAYPVLSFKNDTTWVNPMTKFTDALKATTEKDITGIYNNIAHLSSEMQDIASAPGKKNWTAYYNLKSQVEKLYNLANAKTMEWAGKIPDLTQYYADLHAATIYSDQGDLSGASDMLRQAKMDKAHAPYVLTSAQNSFLYMPRPVQQAYVAKIVEGLDMPSEHNPYDLGKYFEKVTGSTAADETGLKLLYWDYLTPFQQDILSAYYPDQIAAWKYKSWFYLQGPGVGSKGAELTGVPAQLQWTAAALKQYDARGGQPAPASLQGYLKLPANPGVKANYLVDHPDLAQWLQLGPLGQMPTVYKDIAVGGLIKYGTTGSGGKGGSSWTGLHPAHYHGSHYNGTPGPQGSGYADYKWAEYQLYAWSRRGNAKAPATYNLWVNMPSGEAKALYLKQHPEIGKWIRLGPMENMPEAYRTIVQQILQMYGDWTTAQSPLATTITQYFATPAYARQEFLSQHPELLAYWADTETPAQNAINNVVNQYFQIQDVNAKKAYLLAHPELQDYFLQARNNRYEKFMNQVAAYMGANPSMFTEYMKEQTNILAELLRRYAEGNLIKETYLKTEEGGSGSVTSTGTDESRQRNPEKRHRVRNMAA